MGCVESKENVHMVTNGNGNSNEIVGKWGCGPFCDAMAMERNTHICNFTVAIAVAVSHHVNTLIWFPTTHLVSIAIKNPLRMNSCNDFVA